LKSCLRVSWVSGELRDAQQHREMASMRGYLQAKLGNPVRSNTD